MNAKGIIRKISIGDIKEGITYKVDQEMLGGRIRIEQILQDLDVPPTNTKFDVYVSERGSDSVRLWKSFINVPTSIEYDISMEKNENV
jgi:hypothetical protein